jgi:uncharacterized protein YjiS (DUF1127 family)
MSLFKKIADLAAYRRTLRELQSLDNRQLSDIGLNRYDLRVAARHGN